METMKELIKNFPEQFKFAPEIKNLEKLAPADKFIVCGMGGSALAAGLLKIRDPRLDLLLHRDFGLARAPDYFLREGLVIAISYSGDTAETIDAFTEAVEAGLRVAAVTSGGKLLDLARARGLPYVELPTGIVPRLAVGLMVRALAKISSSNNLLGELGLLADVLRPLDWEIAGRDLCQKLVSRALLIYSSTVNLPLAYAWKVQFNENAKVPAFFNIFPELDHNEIAGFDSAPGDEDEKWNFAVVMLVDPADDPRLRERQAAVTKLYREKGLPVIKVELVGRSVFEKIFNSYLLAVWTSYYLARQRGVDPLATLVIEGLKKLAPDS